MRFIFIFCVSCLFISACTTVKQNYQSFRNQPNAYLNSQEMPCLQVPAGIEHAPLMADHQVPVCNTPPAPTPQKISLIPPESLAEQVATGKISLKSLKRIPSGNLQERNQKWFLMLTDEKDVIWDKLDKAFKNRLIRVLEKNKATYTYFIVDTYPTRGKITLQSPIYQVHLQTSQEQNTEVYITDNKGDVPNRYVARRLLTEIGQGLCGDKIRDMRGLLKKVVTGK